MGITNESLAPASRSACGGVPSGAGTAARYELIVIGALELVRRCILEPVFGHDLPHAPAASNAAVDDDCA